MDPSYSVQFPPAYDAEEFIWAAKGYLVVEVHTTGPPVSVFVLTLYNPARLLQTIEGDFESGAIVFAEENLVVVPQVTRSVVESAIAQLARSGFDRMSTRVE
jgi:hypothetical protein